MKSGSSGLWGYATRLPWGRFWAPIGASMPTKCLISVTDSCTDALPFLVKSLSPCKNTGWTIHCSCALSWVSCTDSAWKMSNEGQRRTGGVPFTRINAEFLYLSLFAFYHIIMEMLYILPVIKQANKTRKGS